MKLSKSLLIAGLLGLSGISAAWAGHTSVSVGIGVGVPVYGPRYYGPGYGYGYYGPRYYGPRYYGPAYYGGGYYPYPAPVYAAPVVVQQPVVVQPQPQVYVEQPQQQTGVQPRENSPYWYFCAERNAYYPYVKSCPAGWQQVTPTPQQDN